MIALDTSVAVPMLVETHDDHAAVVAWRAGREVCLCGHSLAETYSVLTRLPGDMRAAPADVAQAFAERFAPPLVLSENSAAKLADVLAQRGIMGGATYDAMVALAALEYDAQLATRDARARRTYEAVGASVIVVPTP